jgi:hypothetical protein
MFHSFSMLLLWLKIYRFDNIILKVFIPFLWLHMLKLNIILSLFYSGVWFFKFKFILPLFIARMFSMMVQLSRDPPYIWWHLCKYYLWYSIGSHSCHCSHIPFYYSTRSFWCLLCIITHPKYLGSKHILHLVLSYIFIVSSWLNFKSFFEFTNFRLIMFIPFIFL